ncbi:hypothetical protein [Bradyrhizobium liaoningense]|uniref:hypothetical protein n=1 Tax=Bradyrhizobium liaoningense TaxID=43992 RepID=UPI001BABC8A4|nr:hypothetical protein [Bradyrhizobium liaoningense]MBR0901578.1 hypothetical protein [Bradyrhizobium liaoningense]
MAMTVELLAQAIGLLPVNEGTEAVLSFLKQPDLMRMTPARDQPIFTPAKEFLRVYRIREVNTKEAGIVPYGLPSLLSALERLEPTALLTLATFATGEWYCTFWLDQVDRLVGFVLVKRRSPEEEQAHLDWFRRNLT